MMRTLLMITILSISTTAILTHAHVAHAQESPASVEIRELEVGTEIQDRELVGESERFSVSDGQVFAWMNARNSGEPSEVTVIWSLDGRERSRYTAKIGQSPRWRTWSRITLRDRSRGAWTVTVLDQSGETLATASFQVD